MSELTLHLLIVDDEESIRKPLADHLKIMYHYHVDTAANGEDAWQLLSKSHGLYDVALIDQVLEGDISGLDLLQQIKTTYPEMHVIIFTGWGIREDEGIEILRQGAYRYFAKPYNLEELALTIRFASEQRQIHRERKYLSELVQVSRELTQTNNLKNQLELVWNYIKKQLDMPTFFIALYDSATNILQFHQSYDEGEPDPLPDRYLSEDSSSWGIAGYVVRTGQEQVWFNHEPAMQKWRSLGIEPHLSGKGHSEMGICIPLQVGEKILGALSIQSYQPQAFDQAFLNAARTLGSHLAPAIENARLISTLERTSGRLHGLVESSLDAVIFIGIDKRITVFNKQAEAMFGYTAEDMIGNNTTRLHPDINEARRIWELVDQLGKIVSYKITLKHKDGTEIPAFLSAVSVKDAEGNAIGQAGFIRDLRQVYLLEERLRALINASHAIGGLLETDQILQLIVKSAIAAFPSTEKGSIHLYDENTGRLHIRASFGYTPRVAEAVTFKIGEGFAGWVYEHGVPIVSGNAQEDKRFKAFDYPEMQGQKSMICTPLLVKGKVIGTLSLDNLSDYDAFMPDDVELLSTFAVQAANTIENAYLFQTARQGREYLQALYKASSAIISPRDPVKVLQTIVDTLCEATNAWRAVILLVDESDRPRILASSGFDQQLDVATSIRETGISRQVLRSGKPYFFQNLLAAKEEVHPAMLAQGTKAAACLPLPLPNRNIGVLWIQFRDNHQFSDIEQQSLQLYANQSAIAYDNARRIAELEQLHAATGAMAGVAEPRDVLQQIVKSAREVLDASYTLIWSYDAVRDVFIPEELVAENVPEDWLKKFRQEEPHTGKTTRHVLDVGYVEITDLSIDPADFLGDSTRVSLESLGVNSFQSIRLDVAGEILGVLHVDYKTVRGFGAEERRLLENFSNHAALALKKARLLRQVNRARNAAAVVAQIVALGKDAKDTWDSIVAGAKDALPCDAVTLYRYNKNNGELEYPPAIIGVNYPEKVLLLPKVPETSIVWKTLRSDNMIIVDDASTNQLTRDRRFTVEEGIKSMVAIPLIADKHEVGAMFVNYRNTHRFVEDELINIKLFADQSAIAISNAQLHQEARKRAEVLQGLYQASQTITSTLSLEETLARVAKQALRIVGADCQQEGCFSYIYLRDGNRLRFVVASSPDMKRVLEQQVEIDLIQSNNIGIIGQVIKTGISANVHDVRANRDYISINASTQAQLSVPLKRGELVTGILTIEHPALNAFASEDVQNLELLAAQAAVAIENAQLFKATEKVTSSLDLEDTFTTICQVAVDYFKVDHSGLLLFDEDYKTGKIVAEYPKTGSEGKIIPLLGVPMEEKLIESREPLVVKDVLNEAGFEPVRDILTELGTRSIMIIPIIGQKRLLGSFGLDMMKQQRDFTPDEIELCKIFATQAAVAIENARHHRETEKVLVARTALAWTGMISSTWRHTIEKHAVTIREQVELLRADLVGSSPSDLTAKRLEMIQRLANQMLKKPITPPLSAEEGGMAVSINGLVRDRTNQLWNHDIYKAINLDLDLTLEDDATVRASPEWLRRALDILIDNAVDATEGLHERRITISSHRVGDQAEILIHDNGPGIPPNIQKLIFREPIKKSLNAKGLGMGLLFAQTIIQTYLGEISLKETGVRGTTMAVSLPLET